MPNLAVELGVGMFSTKAGDFTTYEGGGIVEKASIKVDVIPITLNLKGIYPIDKLDLYALGGVGLYHAKAKVDGTSTAWQYRNPRPKSAFGFQLGVGADYNFLPNVFAGLEFKYLWAKPKFTVSKTAAEFKAKIDGMQITANIGYRF